MHNTEDKLKMGILIYEGKRTQWADKMKWKITEGKN